MDINNNISIIQKKPRGRPKKVIDETIEIKLPNPNGRPKKYLTDEELKQAKRLNSKNDYERRGFLYAKIKSLKKTYKMTYPNKEEYEGKTNDELIELVKNMSDDVAIMKRQQKIFEIQKLQNKLIDEVNKKDFKPKLKF